jgi:hypothetical protein
VAAIPGEEVPAALSCLLIINHASGACPITVELELVENARKKGFAGM